MDFFTALGVFVLIDILLICWIFLRKRSGGLSAAERKFFQQQWNKIAHMDAHRGIIEADKLLHKALEKKGYFGTVARQLESASGVFPQLDALWRAHKLRNKLAHELDFHVDEKTFRNALRSFERGLRDLNVL